MTVASTGERVAVNVDPRESPLETVTPQEFVAGLERVTVSGRAADRQREMEQGQALWRYGAFALLALLAVEGLVAARPRRAGVTPLEATLSADDLATPAGTGEPS
jgi:hypothetical protein